MQKTKYRIEVDHSKCIGNGICVVIDSANIKLEKGKAIIREGNKDTHIFFVEKEISDAELTNTLQGAELCPANAIKIINLSNKKDLVNTKIAQETAKVINAQYDDAKDFVLDPNGYFLIRIIPQTKEIEVGFCGAKNKVEVIIRGKKPIDIYHTIANLKLISRMEHASYLGRELQKAFIALQKGIKYVQDDELIF